MAGKYAGVNNRKLTNRPTCGGDKKQGSVPKATSFFIANSTGNKYRTRTNTNYPLSSKSCPKSWNNYKTVGSTTKINGMRVFSN